MGECAYFIKAQFKSAPVAYRTLSKVRKFLKEVQKAEDFMYTRYGPGSTNKKAIWKEMKEKFPTAAEYLETTQQDPDDSISRVWIGSLDEIAQNLQQDGDVISYSAYIGHFSDWSFLAAFLKNKFEAKRVVYAKEEDGTGSLEDLDLYEYQEIVEHLVQQAKVYHPLRDLLKGIHRDLDAMITN